MSAHWRDPDETENPEILPEVDPGEVISELRSEILRLTSEFQRSERREARFRAALEAAGIEPATLLGNPEPVPAAEEPPTWLKSPSSPPRATVAAARQALDRVENHRRKDQAVRLLGELLGPAADRRLAAARSLLDLVGRDAAAALELAFESARDVGERVALLELLARSAASSSARVAVLALDDERWEVRAAAVEAGTRLAGGDVEAVQRVVRKGLADRDARVRRRTVLAAASVPGFEAAPELLALVSDPDPQTRRVACAALEGTLDRGALSALIRALLDGELTVRRAAARTLGQALGRDLDDLVLRSEPARRRAASRLRLEIGAVVARQAVEREAHGRC